MNSLHRMKSKSNLSQTGPISEAFLMYRTTLGTVLLHSVPCSVDKVVRISWRFVETNVDELLVPRLLHGTARYELRVTSYLSTRTVPRYLGMYNNTTQHWSLWSQLQPAQPPRTSSRHLFTGRRSVHTPLEIAGRLARPSDGTVSFRLPMLYCTVPEEYPKP